MQTTRGTRRNFDRGTLALGLCLGAFLAVGQAGAMGGGNQTSTATGKSSGSEKPKGSSSDLTTCSKGKVWDAKHKSCIRMQSGALPDDAMADYAYALAKADRYADAIEVLDLLGDPNTAKALNYRGYATRKLGRTDEGIGYYLRSVAMDPTYAQVREYLGEAYVIKGRLDLAKDQLATIRTLCGTQCEAYQDLSEAVGKASGL